LDSGRQHIELLSVAELIEELEIAGLMQASARGLRFSVVSVDPTVTIEGDRQTLLAAISNLLQNAFKFTRKDSQGVHIHARHNQAADLTCAA
jgi:signal transduction histidine kinase